MVPSTVTLTPGLQSFLKVLKTSDVDSATENLISLLKRHQLRSSHSCAVATAYLLRRVVSTSKVTDPERLIDCVQNVGRRLIAAQPREMVVGNIVRRVLGLIREEAEDGREAEFCLSSDAGTDTQPHTPPAVESQATLHPPSLSTHGPHGGTRGASFLSRSEGRDADWERGTNSSVRSETMERSSSRPPMVSYGSFATTTTEPPVVSMFRLLSYPQVESPQARSPGNASPSGRIRGQFALKDFKAEVIDGIGEIVDELSQVEDQIASYALEHIHSDEVILTYTSSVTVYKFLSKAAAKRKFTVIHAESYPNSHRETHAVVAGRPPVRSGDEENLSPESFQKSLTELGVTVILIPDSAVFALMSRVNKVILGTHSVLANGGLVSEAGTRAIANAAKVHKIPVIVVSGIYKLSPVYPFDYESLIEYGDSSAVLPYEAGDLEKIDVENPLYDYVPAELVDLYITNLGGHAPSYLYRIVSDHYRKEDISF
ncbi:translation regulator GCD7 [Histoplasma ohiense]|nr:translation regulator GCD7 [Histoplasma ohiense (nom. inval.)]